MHGGALHGDVAASHARLAAVIEDKVDLAFDDDAEVEGLRPVHHAHILRGEVDHAAHGATLDGEAEAAAGYLVVVEAEVVVAVEVGREGIRIDLVERQHAVLEGLPRRRSHGLKDGLAVGVVAGDERRGAWQVGCSRGRSFGGGLGVGCFVGHRGRDVLCRRDRRPWQGAVLP